jgi:16S rRNA (guanine527-N7)-methyltransferase
MGADSYASAVAAARWVGRPLTEDDLQNLNKYHDWLAREAIAAGGLGPHEKQRLWNRHIADSMLFGVALQTSTDCLDIGSGVGLPGIPLAITNRDVSFRLLDRSGGRCDLMRRAIAVLGLDNCVVAHQDVSQIDEKFGSIVSRAAIPPTKLVIHVKHLLSADGIAVLGLSRSADTTNPLRDTTGIDSQVLRIPSEVLDTDVNLLRIAAT